jgi:hypothetical protein
MPAYVPAVLKAELAGREELHVTLQSGTVVLAWLRIYRDSRQLAWGTHDNEYRGELHVVPRPSTAGVDTEPPSHRASLTVTLRSDRLDVSALASLTETVVGAIAGTARRTSGAQLIQPDPTR